MDLYNHALRKKESLKQKIEELESQMSQYPEGSLRTSVKNGVTSYYIRTKDLDGKEHRSYIRKSNEKIVTQLLCKSYACDLHTEYISELNLIRRFLDRYKKIPRAITKLKKKNKELQKQIVDNYHGLNQYFLDWQHSEYKKNPFHPEQLTVKAITGEMVRSKSEALILSLLFQYHIPYRYECELDIGGKKYYPDFTILHPDTKEHIYFEHFGMMDDPQYASNCYNKLQTYSRHGIVPSHNLIVTYETASHPLDSTYLDFLIRYHFHGSFINTFT